MRQPRAREPPNGDKHGAVCGADTGRRIAAGAPAAAMAMGSPGPAAGALAQRTGNVGHPDAAGRLIAKGAAAQRIPPPDCPCPNASQFCLDQLGRHDNMRGAQGESELGGLENGPGAPRLAPGSAPAAWQSWPPPLAPPRHFSLGRALAGMPLWDGKAHPPHLMAFGSSCPGARPKPCAAAPCHCSPKPAIRGRSVLKRPALPCLWTTGLRSGARVPGEPLPVFPAQPCCASAAPC